MIVTKAIIPAAGLGTRFLPATKAVPKEMMPLFNRPAIEEIASECYHSGITDLLCIVNTSKKAIKDHFSSDTFVMHQLQKLGKTALVANTQKLIENLTISFANQEEPRGLGDALLKARSFVGDQFFSLLLPDDFIASDIPALKTLINYAQQYNATVIAVEEVSEDRVSAYGIIASTPTDNPDLYRITHVVEKPALHEAPSRMAIVGRYVFSPKIFDHLERLTPQSGKELQLTDAISNLITSGEPVLACTINGKRFDTGNPVGWLEAVLHYGSVDPQYGLAIKELIRSFNQ